MCWAEALEGVKSIGAAKDTNESRKRASFGLNRYWGLEQCFVFWGSLNCGTILMHHRWDNAVYDAYVSLLLCVGR